MENAVLTQIGPAADAIVQLEQDLGSAIVGHLADAEGSLGAVDDALTQRVAAHFVPAYHALSTIGQDLQNTVRGQMNNAALYLSALQGEPVDVHHLMTMPLAPSTAPTSPVPVPPGKVPHILPPGGPGPQTPIVRPPQRIPTVPPNVPAPPAVVPEALPGAPGLPGGAWGNTAPAGPAASSTAQGGAVGKMAKSSDAWHNTFDPATGSFLFEDPDQDPPNPPPLQPTVNGTVSGSVVCNSTFLGYSPSAPGPPPPIGVTPPYAGPAPAEKKYADGSGCCWWVHSLPVFQAGQIVSWAMWKSPIDCTTISGTSPPSTPTSPPSTPTSPPSTPTSPPSTPTSPPSTPTSPPSTTPCSEPSGGPAGLGLPPLPAGWAWQWDTSSCSYYQVPTPTPTPPPSDTPPAQTPTPTPSLGSPAPTAACAGTKDDPCWRAANEMNDKDQAFHVTSGLARGFADGKAQAAKNFGDKVPDVNFKPQMIDLADNPVLCDLAYQMNLIDPGNQVIDVLPAFNDIGDIFNAATDNMTLVQKVANWTILAPIAIAVQTFTTVVSRLITLITTRFYTMNNKLGGEASQRSAFNVMNTICFGGLDRIKKIWDYQANFNYPVDLPSPEFAASAWLGNEIDECTFQTYVMAGDFKWAPYRRCVQAGKMKYTALELKTLDKRGGIVRGTLATRLRELGSLHPEDNFELDTLFNQVPAAGDLIRFMVRDTANQDTVDHFEMDKNFTPNFSGDVKDWAYMQGLSDKVMLHNWRAHWSIPAPTQLYVMLHRLRHDPAYSATHDVVGDVRAALIQQDILPYWIDGLMRVSYHPLTRTDLNRAYERGWVSDDDYVNGMYQNGYSDDDAQTLLRFVKNERLLAVKNSDFGTRFIHGFISREQTLDLAHAEGFDPTLDGDVMGILGPLRDLELQRKQLEGLIHQYKRCWISKDDLVKAADGIGIPEEVVDWQLEWAGEDTTCGTKRETVAALCTALDQGVIVPSEYVDRMQKLKFDQHAIDTYLTLCTNKIKAAQAKKEAAAVKAAQQEADKEQKQADKDAQNAARRANQIAKALATAERKRQARNKMLEEAGNRLGQYLTDAPGPPSTFVQGLYHQIMDNWMLSQDEAASILNMASSKAKGMTSAQFTTWVNELAQTSLKEPWLSYFPEPVATNGHV